MMDRNASNATLNCKYAPTDQNWTCPAASCKFEGGPTVASGQNYKAADAAANNPDTQGDPDLDCGTEKSRLDWIVCPVVKLVSKTLGSLDNAIINMLEVAPKVVDENDASAGARYYKAWQSFRGIALGILVVAALIMLIGQALGFEVLDAYTLKKVMPRLVVAIIGIALSWQLIKWFVLFTNDLGLGVRSLILAPFQSGLGNHLILGGGASIIIELLTVGAIAAMGIVGMGLLALTALMGIVVAIAVLLIRQIVIVLLIMLAPIAIACYVLPNTQTVWKLWHESFTKALLMFPIIMGFIAAGRVFAMVSSGTGVVGDLIAFGAYILPYFLIPATFKFAGGAMRTIGGFANDRSKGLFDRAKKARQDHTKARMGAVKQGFDRSKVGSALAARRQQKLNKLSALGSGALPGTARRRADMESAHTAHLAHGAAEAIKSHPSAAANDDANAAARAATSRADFATRYRARPGHANASDQEINQQISELEQAYGTSIGSLQMKHTAATAALASNASTDSVQERAQWMRDAVSNHVMTSTQAAALVKQSGSLASSAGFGDLLNVTTKDPATGTYKLSSDALLTKATLGFNPANSQRLRVGQARQMAQEVLRQADEASYVHEVDTRTGEVKTDAATGQPIRKRDAAGNFVMDLGSDEFAKAIADAAGLHDVMNGMTPDVREEFAKHLNGAAVAGSYIREHEQIMEGDGGRRTPNGAYLDRRKSWSSAAVAGTQGRPGEAPPEPPA